MTALVKVSDDKDWFGRQGTQKAFNRHWTESRGAEEPASHDQGYRLDGRTVEEEENVPRTQTSHWRMKPAAPGSTFKTLHTLHATHGAALQRTKNLWATPALLGARHALFMQCNRLNMTPILPFGR